MIIHILILAFICLIIYQLFTLNIIEGLDDPSITSTASIPDLPTTPTAIPTTIPTPTSVPDSVAGSSTSSPALISTPPNVVAAPSVLNQECNSSNPLILSQQNAGNISILNQQLNTLSSQFNKTQTQSNKNTADITSLNDQMASISAAQTKYATSTTAAFTPPS